MPSTGSSRRAALKAQQEREAQRKRTNRIILVAAIVVAVIVLGIVGYVVVRALTGGGQEVTPPNATADHGIMVTSEAAPADALKVVIVEDFQCSACYGASTYYSKLLNELVVDGSITLEYRQVAYQGEMSAVAAQGAAAADVVGYFTEYSDAVFSHASEGYTKELLRETVPAEIGMTGDDLVKFQKMFDDGSLAGFVEEATSDSIAAGTPHTPYVTVNGNEAPLLVEGDSGGAVPATELTAAALLAYFQSKAG